MATREEVMATVERLIRRGELGDAAGLLEVWLRSNPQDAVASAKLASVRALADPSELRSTRTNGAARPPSAPPVPVGRASTAPAAPRPAPVAAPPPQMPAPRPLPSDPIAMLEELLARVNANRRQ